VSDGDSDEDESEGVGEGDGILKDFIEDFVLLGL
jgi:hypothetical protein